MSSSSPPPISLLKPQEWNPLVVTLVGFLCTIFLVFSYYKIFRRHCCWFRAVTISRSSRFQRRMINEANTNDPNWLQFESRGLDSFVMHSIPITQFRKKNEEEEDQLEKAGNTDCAVCLGEFEEGEWVKSLPNCCHVFHVACIDTWFQIHSSCPLCRSYVYDLPTHNDYSVSMHTLFETLRRGDQNSAEVSARNEALRSQILQNASVRLDTDNER